MPSVEEIKFLLPRIYLTSKVSVLLLGAPGIGKSRIVRTAAEMIAEVLGKKFVEYDDTIADQILSDPQKYFVFIDIRLTEHEPSDLSGIPRTDGDYVTFKPLKWAKVLSKAAGMLFLDELTNVEDPTLKGVSYKLLLDRAAGFVKFSPEVMVVAAGNTPDNSSIASTLAAPQINRTLVIDVGASKVEEWLEWLTREATEYKHFSDDDIEELKRIKRLVDEWRSKRAVGKLYTIMSAYLTYRRDALVTTPPPETMENFATPRTWEMLYRTLTDHYKEIYGNQKMTEIICVGLLGRKVGTQFNVWLWKTPPRVEDVMKDPSILDKVDYETKILFAAYFGWYLRSIIQQIQTDQALAKKVDAVASKILDEGRELVTLVVFNVGGNARERIKNAVILKNRIPAFKRFYEDVKRILKLGI